MFLWFRGSLALLAATAVAIPAQQSVSPLRLDQKALLEKTRHAYYLPLERGTQGFVCHVSFDWSDILERASGRPIPPKEPTLVALKSATVTVIDDIVKGATLKTEFAKEMTSANSPAASRQKIMNKVVTASLNGWNPFLSDRIFPVEGTKYHFESAATGYRLTLEGGNFFSILDLDSGFRIIQGESHLNGTTTSFTPAFDPSTHGWLITSLDTVTTQSTAGAAGPNAESSSSAEGAGEDKASFGFTYQFVDDILIPKHVTVQYAGGLETPYELKDCTLVKTAIPIAKP